MVAAKQKNKSLKCLLTNSCSLPCKHEANTAAALLSPICASPNAIAHSPEENVVLLHLYSQLLSFPRMWNSTSHCCSYYPVSIRFYFHFLWVFRLLALHGVISASPAITSFTENSIVVWCVNWPLVQSHSAGIWMLKHWGTSMNGKTNERTEGICTAWWPSRSQERWGHSCLISK